MKQYEITIITKEDLKEKPIVKEIESLGGKIIIVNSLGQKQLAYPVKKEKIAFYTSILFEIEGEKIIELNRKLGLKEEILRHLIIIAKEAKIQPEKKVAKVKTKTEEIKETVIKPSETEKVIAQKEEKPIGKPKAPKKQVLPTKKPTPKKETAPPSAGVDEKERLEALDKKLDELLKE